MSLFVAVFLLFMSGCSPGTAETVDLMDGVAAMEWPDAAEEMDEAMINSVEAFSWDLFVRSLEEEGNVLVSPASVYLALAMTMNGARGDTLEAMENVLKTGSMDLETVNSQARNWTALLREETEKTVTTVANSIWLRLGYNVSTDFLQANAEYFDAGAMGLDFSDEKSVDVINGWVEENTNGAIDEIIDEIDPQTMMYLINAIYFKSEWEEKFCGEDTDTGTFYGLDGTMEVTYMHRTGEMEYLDWNGYRGVVLPYESQGYEFFAILPEEGQDLIAALDEEGPEFLAEILEQGKDENVTLTLPKFEMNYEKKLDQYLKDMGMAVAFSGQADFSGMNEAGISELFIGEVLHKTFMRADEEGTEAAAVTSVDIRLTAVPEEGILLSFDRPFLFGIWNSQTKTLLFIGRMEEPEAE